MQSVYQNTLWFLKSPPPILKSNTINTNYFTTFLKTSDSDFQIIIDKHKCDVNGGFILELIKICYINNL